jgi:four helix bundle protein
MKNFRDLKVWEKAHQLTVEVYRMTRRFPADERFGLTSQLRRASVSIPSNIAEGCGRRGNAEFHRFLQMAAGSASEVEYQLLLAKNLGYWSQAEYSTLQQRVVEVKKMLGGLITKVDIERSEAAARS